MSNLKHINLAIRNVDALRKAAEDKGLLFLQDAKDFIHYGSLRRPCDHAIRVPAETRHELGVVRIGDGTWNLQYDEDSRAIASVIPDLTQMYQVHAVQAELPEGCYVESITQDAEGNMLVLVGDNE